MLPNYTVLDGKLDELPEVAVRDLQTRRLMSQVRHCYRDTAFWRKKFDEIGLAPDDIQNFSDLSKIPFCTKAELQEDQKRHPPFGSYLGVDQSRLAKYFTTSGTTGRPVVRVYTDRDWAYVRQRFQRRPFMGKLIKKWGGAPVAMSAPEVYMSLERGVIDAILDPLTLMGLKCNEVTEL